MATIPGCPICDRDSLLIYPVRYAIACPRGAAKAPALSGNFRIDARAPQAVATAKYTLRPLRQGYLYTYDEKRKKLRAFMVLDDGVLYQFAPSIVPPPGNAAENNVTQGICPSSDMAPESYGRCVGVQHTPGSDEATNFWIGWSNVRWTRDTVFNKIGDATWRKKHMQCINVPAMVAGNEADTGEFQATRSKIAHFTMDDRAMKEAFGFSNRSPKDEIKLRQRHADARIGDVMAQSPLKKGFVVAVNDPVGITNDLSELTVPNLNNGFDAGMYWKYVSAQLLERAEAGIRANAKMETQTSYAVSAAINMGNQSASPPTPMSGGESIDFGYLYRVTKGWIKTGSLEKAADEDSKRSKNVPEAANESANEAWGDAYYKKGPDGKPQIGPDGKPVTVIDTQALQRFRDNEYPHALDAFKPKWAPLVQAHADWLKSQLLADWMAGNHDTKDLRSGYAYSESCAQSIGAAAGTEACQKVLNDWLNGQASDARNLYVRALMFNQETLMKAADTQVHGSDIQYENILNLYKEAFKQIEKLGNAANLRDRLVVTTANTIVNVLVKGGKGAAIGFATIRLSLHAGVSIKAAHITPAEMRNWVFKQGDALGLNLDGDRLERQAAAANIRREVFKAAPPSDSAVFAYAIDTDAWVKSGKLDASEVKAIKLPGVEMTRKWLGSSSPVEFNQGIATAIFQIATLRFAYKDFKGSDSFNYNETLLKLSGAVVSTIGNLVETVSETVAKAPEHPLSAFLMKHWAWFNHDTAEITAKVARWSGAVAGVILSCYDLFKNAPEAYGNKEYGLTALYVVGGTLGVYIALSPLLSAVPFIAAWMPPLWPILVISIVIGFVIVYFKSAAINDWVSRCKFSKEPGYHTMDEELKAFNSAMGD